MKDDKAKYLIVNGEDITKQLYQVERVAYCNDFDNIHHRVKKLNASEIFTKNNVPEEYQKIIIKISSTTLKKEAEEYTTRYPFDFKTKTIKEVNNKKYIRMNNRPIYYDESIFDDKFVFKTEAHYISFNNIMYFIEEIYRNGYLENYIQSIKEFFDISLDLDLLFNAWNNTNNINKTLKMYKQRVTSKKYSIK